MRYTYTIFNADPDSSEEAEMPCLDNVVVSGDSAKDVAEQALREACGIARANAEHEPTDRLWVWVWNERGQIPFKTSCEVGNRPYKRRKFLDAIIGPRPVRQNTDRLGKRVYGERKRQANSWTSGTADI